MEEGGAKEPCYIECNKDHLATVKVTLKPRENNKQWLVSGFNGFGQLKFENKRKLQQFVEIQMPFTNNCDDVLVACSWNCFAVANGCSLHLQGFVLNCPNTTEIVQAEAPIKCLAICDKFCLVLLENGKVYKIAVGSEYELKEIKFQNSLIPQATSIFGDKKATKFNLQITHIACGNNITVAISKANDVFTGTTQIYQFPKHQHVKQLECGFEHALLLTANGDIYAWGNGLRGQLGHEVLRVEENPTMIAALAGIKITYIAAGGWHSAAISAFGDLYTWGFNSNGQLGLRLYKAVGATFKEPSVYPLPQVIDIQECECCKNSTDLKNLCYPNKVAAGARHTIVQMNCGSIIASGWNLYGQLGLANCQQHCDNFKYVFTLGDKHYCNIKQIICGNWCTILKNLT